MKIIVYNPNTEEFHDFINSPRCSDSNRNVIINEFIEKNGKEISAKEYWCTRYNYRGWTAKEKVKFIGDPTTILEKLISFIDDSASYCHMKETFPEDFIESRTDWESLEEYADEMDSFIRNLADELSIENNITE